MKTYRLLALAALAAALLGAALAASAQDADDEAAIRALIDAFIAGDGDALYALFDPSVQAVVTPAVLASSWLQIESAFGTYNGIDSIVYDPALSGYRVTLAFTSPSGGTVTQAFATALSPTNAVLGFVLLPGEGGTTAPAVAPLPAYADPAAYTESELALAPEDLADQPVRGLLTLPVGADAAPVPAVIILSGSGPTDADGTLGAQVAYRDLAVGLSSRGIAVLRYDDRTLTYPQTFANRPTTVDDEYLVDLRAAVAELQANPAVDSARIYLLGHSQGGIVLPRMAAAFPEGTFAGLIFASGTTTLGLLDLGVRQVRYLAELDGVISDDEQAAIDQFAAAAEAVAALSEDTDPLTMVSGAPASYWLDLRAYDSAATYAALDLPALVIQGERDYQMTSEDLAAWLAAVGDNANLTVRTFPCVIHSLVAVPDCEPGLGSNLDYTLALNVAEDVIGAIAEWIAP